MKFVIYKGSGWLAPITIGLVIVTIIGGARTAVAQSNTFEVVGHTTSPSFSVNGTALNNAIGADLPRYLNLETNNTRLLLLEWNLQAKGGYIELMHTGDDSVSIANVAVTRDDLQQGYSVADVALYYHDALRIDTIADRDVETFWIGKAASNRNELGVGAKYSGYSTLLAASALFLGGTDAVKLVSQHSIPATDVGIIVLGNLRASTATPPLTLGGRDRDPTDRKGLFGNFTYNGPTVAYITPEGSSLTLIVAGILPLAWQISRFRRRKTA